MASEREPRTHPKASRCGSTQPEGDERLQELVPNSCAKYNDGKCVHEKTRPFYLSPSRSWEWTAKIAGSAIHSLEVKLCVANGLHITMFIFPEVVAKPVFDAMVMCPLLLPWTLESELRDHVLVCNAV